MAFCRTRSYLSMMRKQDRMMLHTLATVFAGHPLPSPGHSDRGKLQIAKSGETFIC